MAKRRNVDNTRANLMTVRLLEPGTRMRCRDNGRIYQLGNRVSQSQYHMLCEDPPERGIVHVNTIMNHFEVVKGEIK